MSVSHSFELLNAIEAELLEVERLVALIQREQDVLVSRHLDQISPILELKTLALQQLEVVTRERIAVADRLDLKSASDVSEFLQFDSSALAQWQQLQLQAKLAEVLNRSNAQLVKCHEEANHHLMSLLSKQKNQEMAYSADGRLSHQSGLGRPLDRA
jgi:flagellar biosynthesis/type III secretory pathway chaperone